MHVEGLDFVLVFGALFAGAVLQGTLGFGMVLLAFPALVIIEPELLPQTTLIVAMPMIFGLAIRNRGNADWGEIGMITLGRVPGIVAAVVIVDQISARTLSLGAGVTVLLAVAASLWAPALPRTKPILLMVGAVSSLFGTAVSIGGPALGLVYQHEEGPAFRGTLTKLMLSGAPLSFAALAVAGQVSSTDVRTGLALIPASVAGSYSARFVIPWFDERLRPIVLGVCALAAVIAMARVALMG